MHVERRQQSDMDSLENDDDEEKRTIFCANIQEKCTEELLYELFVQGGPVESVRIVKDKDGRQKTYGFVTYVHACSVTYALELFDGIKLFNQRLVLKPKQQNIPKSYPNNAIRSFVNPVANSFQIQTGPSSDMKNPRFNTEVLARLGADIILNTKERSKNNAESKKNDDGTSKRTIRDSKPYAQSNPFKRPEAKKVGERNRGYGSRSMKSRRR